MFEIPGFLFPILFGIAVHEGRPEKLLSQNAGRGILFCLPYGELTDEIEENAMTFLDR